MADLSRVCELCEGDHVASFCPVLSNLQVSVSTSGKEEHRESHLAYQSLPEWVQVQEYDRETHRAASGGEKCEGKMQGGGRRMEMGEREMEEEEREMEIGETEVDDRDSTLEEEERRKEEGAQKLEGERDTEGREVRLVVTKAVPRLTRLGPLLAPHTPSPSPHNPFPLKICHKGGSCTYLDLSRKWLCNWLSLIPVGSTTNRNLLACQIDDLIYYMAVEDLSVGSELRVWYAPFSQHRPHQETRCTQDCSSVIGAAVAPQRITREAITIETPETPISNGTNTPHTSHTTLDLPVSLIPSTTITTPTSLTSNSHHHASNTTLDIPVSLIQSTGTPHTAPIPLTSSAPQIPHSSITIPATFNAHPSFATEASPVPHTDTSPAALIPFTPQPEPSIRIAPSLARISVGKGQITFTHNTWVSEDVHSANQFSDQLLDFSSDTNIQVENNKGISQDVLVIRHPQAGEATSKYLDDNIIHSQQEEHLNEHNFNAPETTPKYLHNTTIHNQQEEHINDHTFNYSIPGSYSDPEKHIEVLDEDVSSPKDDCVVSLTITAGGESQEPGWSYAQQPNYEGMDDEGWRSDSSTEETKKDKAVFTQKGKKRKYQKSNTEKPAVHVADASVVKQLPPHSLGARQPRPWSCPYCQHPTFTTVTAFSQHLKAHLLWVMGRRHVCGVCGLSLSNLEHLKRHQENHNSSLVLIHDSRKGSEGKQPEPRSEEEEEDIDDPTGIPTHKAKKEIAAIPTENITGPYDCQICDRSFVKPHYLLRHLKKHSGDFACKHCLKVFARKESLQKHMCTGGQEEKQLQCGICQRTFLSAHILLAHAIKHKESPRCVRCGWRGATVASLQRHMNICPSVLVHTFFQCTECGKRVTSARQLERHKAHHRYYRQCHFCHKPYHNSTYLALHVALCRQMHQLSSVGHVLCEECGDQFTDTTTFRAHYHTHTHPFLCTSCNHRFQTKVGFQIHTCEVEQRCDECGAVFRSVQALNRHSAIHGPPPHRCHSCQRSYYRKESLDRHACQCESDVKEPPTTKKRVGFPCQVCGFVLATQHSFNTHMLSAHGKGGGGDIMCEVCGKVFQRVDILREHRAVHAPPSHPCPTCHKLFKTTKSLQVHSQIHLDIKRFTCKYCNKKFHQKVNLNRHERRSHFPRGSIKCQHCPLQCLSTEELKSHLLSHTLKQEEVFVADKASEEDGLEVDSENLNLTSKERLRVKEELKSTKEINSNFDTGIVHAVIAPDLSLHTGTDTISNAAINHHQTVFIPQRICLSARPESLTSNYLVATQPRTISSSPSSQRLGNSSVFKVTNNSSSVEDNLASTVLITTSPVPPLDTTHLDPADCQVAEERRTRRLSKEDDNLSIEASPALVDEVCLYQSNPSTSLYQSTPSTTIYHSTPTSLYQSTPTTSIYQATPTTSYYQSTTSASASTTSQNQTHVVLMAQSSTSDS